MDNYNHRSSAKTRYRELAELTRTLWEDFREVGSETRGSEEEREGTRGKCDESA